jgi:prepilin-type N-terminal cleavage/methylation domain-containing protein
MNRHPCGYTMVEVMLVLLILGIVSSIVVPSINGSLDEMKIDGAAREVVSVLHYCQSLAIKEGIAYTVSYDKAQEKFKCYEQGSGLTVLHPIDKKPYEMDFTGAGYFQGVDIVSASFTPGNKNFITFNSLDESDRYGTVVLNYRGPQKTIDISRLVAVVSVN